MAINPESLLIFKARETEEQPEKQGKKKILEKEQTLPKEATPKRLAKFLPEKGTEPMLIEEQKQSVPERTKQVDIQASSKKQEEQVQSAEKQETSTPSTEPKRIRTSLFGTTPFKISNDRERVYTPFEPSIYSDEALSLNKEPEAFHEQPKNAPLGKESVSSKNAAIKRQEQSRAAARNKTCAWHPWRDAYATCGFCNRYFCFQDIVEFNRNYYCLDDIDNVSSKFVENAELKSNNLSIIAGLLLMAAFFVFFYFANAQLLYVLVYLNRVSLPYFLVHINYNYVLALMEGIFAALAFVTAILLFVHSPKRFYMGVFVCLGAVMLFSYQYTGTATLYLGVVDALIFAAFGVLLYSSTTYTIEEVKGPLAALGRNPISWSNIGRF